MACCVVGSLLLVAVMALLRLVRERLLGLPPAAPEQWRLASPVGRIGKPPAAEVGGAPAGLQP